MQIKLTPTSLKNLPRYIELYEACFPSAANLKFEYLSWFYGSNPLGEAQGADAWDGNKLVGQVIAIPGKYILRDEVVTGLLAVNVAVHPSYQGRNLFKKLGLQMCEYGAQAGHRFVIGVANRAATPGWVRKMGFQLVTPLQARLGIGPLSLAHSDSEINQSTQLRHYWEKDSISWRLRNPAKKFYLSHHSSSDWAVVTASADKPGLVAVAEIPLKRSYTLPFTSSPLQTILPRVFLGLIPKYRFSKRYLEIPEKIKPSPLNFIYKNLVDSSDRLDSDTCFINFLDFDAY